MGRILKLWDRAGTRLNTLLDWLAVLAIAIATLLVCVEVFRRYIFSFSTEVYEGGALFLIVCFSFLVVPTLLKRDEHITFTFLQSRLKGRAKRAIDLLIIICGLVACSYTAFYALGLTAQLKEWGQTSLTKEFRLWWLYAFLSAGMILTAFYYLEKLAKHISSMTKRQSGKE